MKFFYLIIIALLITSCSDDENCIDDIVGIYSGNCTSNIGTFQGEMTISKSSTGEFNLLINDEMLDSGISTYDATISSECNTITVPSQSVIFTGGAAATISGTFQINLPSLTGNLNVVVGTVGTICSYNLTKR